MIVTTYNAMYHRIKTENPEEIQDFLKIVDLFTIPDERMKHQPKVRAGRQKPERYFVKKRDGSFLIGNIKRVLKAIDKLGIDYTLEIPVYKDHEYSVEEVKKFIEEFTNLPFTPYDHQIKGVVEIVNNERALLQAATGSGKSLIIYLAILWFLKKMNKNILLVVPSVSLVTQMLSDFKEYDKGYLFKDDFDDVFYGIKQGAEKTTDHQVKVSTFQSLITLDESSDFFEQFGVVIYDEAHRAKSESYEWINQRLINCHRRYGLTGTLPPHLVDKLLLEGLIGTAKLIVTQKELVDLGLATEIFVQPIILKHTKTLSTWFNKVRSEHKRKVRAWNLEDKFLRTSQKRVDFIAKLIARRIAPSGNTIVLFKNLDYGKRLYQTLQNLGVDCVYISGATSAKDREKIRVTLEDFDDRVVVATDKIMSTGINIKKLKNLVFSQAGKSETSIIQGLGRLSRLHKSKDNAIVWDFVDDVRYSEKSKPNYYLKHYAERVMSYRSYEFQILGELKSDVNFFFDTFEESNRWLADNFNVILTQ